MEPAALAVYKDGALARACGYQGGIFFLEGGVGGRGIGGGAGRPDPWQGQNQPPLNSPALEMGTQPRCVHTPSTTRICGAFPNSVGDFVRFNCLLRIYGFSRLHDPCKYLTGIAG